MVSNTILMGVGVMQGNWTMARRILKCEFEWSLEHLFAIFQAQTDLDTESFQSPAYSIFAGKMSDHGEYIPSNMDEVSKDITVGELINFSNRYNQILYKFEKISDT